MVCNQAEFAKALCQAGGAERERSGFPRTGEGDVETRKKGGFMQEEHPKYVPFC